MAICFPTADDVVRFLKEQPEIFISGVVLGISLGIFIGWSFGSSGYIDSNARADLLEEERNKFKEEFLKIKKEYDELALKFEKLNEKEKHETNNSVCSFEKDQKLNIVSELKTTKSLLQTEISKSKIYLDQASGCQTENDSLRKKLISVSKLKEKIKLSAGANQVLVYLFKNPDAGVPNKISETLKIENSLVEHFLEALEDAQFIVKRLGFDGLGYIYLLTKKGRAHVANNKPYTKKRNLTNASS